MVRRECVKRAAFTRGVTSLSPGYGIGKLKVIKACLLAYDNKLCYLSLSQINALKEKLNHGTSQHWSRDKVCKTKISSFLKHEPLSRLLYESIRSQITHVKSVDMLDTHSAQLLPNCCICLFDHILHLFKCSHVPSI